MCKVSIRRCLTLPKTPSGNFPGEHRSDLASICLLGHVVSSLHGFQLLLGGPQQVKLVRDNYNTLLEELQYETLPQTIKDAVKVTLHSGPKPIWIDAPCSIQDDPLDKVNEISKMSEIYKFAIVTISAACAAHADDGFLQPRRLSQGEETFEIPFMSQNGRLGHVLLNRSRDVSGREPIGERGWTLQESLMSPRLLEFGKHQVRWCCRGNELRHELADGWTPSKLGESGLEIDWDSWRDDRPPRVETYEVSVSPGIDPAWRLKRGLAHRLQRSRGGRIRLGIAGANSVTTWEYIVENYTRHELSKPEDRLLALSAIARELQRVSGHEYVAGLRRHAIPRLLLWRVTKRGKRVPKYTAPSWSWASIMGAVTFDGFDSVGVKILDVTVTSLIHNDFFGEIAGGVLKVSGMVSEVMITLDKEQNAVTPYGRVSFWEMDPERSIMGNGYLDLVPNDIDEEIWNEKLLLLVVTLMPTSGLMLRKVSSGGYCRVGYFDLRSGDQNLDSVLEAPSWTTVSFKLNGTTSGFLLRYKTSMLSKTAV